jgi:hypothetical protein
MDHDTLVLRMIQRTENENEYEIFILYDYKEKIFYLRGGNVMDKILSSYSFECDNVIELYNFLTKIFNPLFDDGDLIVSLLAMNNLPLNSKEITYDLLEQSIYKKEFDNIDKSNCVKYKSNELLYYTTIMTDIHNKELPMSEKIVLQYISTLKNIYTKY